MARLDTGWHANPKVLRSGPLGMALHAWSISFCDDARSDGFVPDSAWPAMLSKGVRVLLKEGLWEPVEGGYQLHDYTDYNRTKAEIEAREESARDRQSRHRSRVTNGVTDPVTEPVTNGVTLARAAAPGPGPGFNTSLPGGWEGSPESRARAHEDLPSEVLERLRRAPIPDPPSHPPEFVNSLRDDERAHA